MHVTARVHDAVTHSTVYIFYRLIRENAYRVYTAKVTIYNILYTYNNT